MTLKLCFSFIHRTQDNERGANGALVSQGETVSGLLRYEEWWPKLVRNKGPNIYTYFGFTQGNSSFYVIFSKRPSGDIFLGFVADACYQFVFSRWKDPLLDWEQSAGRDSFPLGLLNSF